MGKELKRMNYFDGLLLEANDYGQDKDYIRRLQGLHNRYLHTWGIVCGLEVRPVIDSSMEVFVTEGAALDLVDFEEGSEVKESTSRQILIYEGHPDNPLDLSEYNANENVYISVSYCDTWADRDNEKGQGKEIHIWERGKLTYSNSKPKDPKKDIVLARVVPKVVQKKSNDGSTGTYEEIIIDSTCIFDTDTDGTPLRVYAGPYARVLELKQFIYKLGDSIDGMPLMEADGSTDEKQLKINSNSVRFTGEVVINDDLWFEGTLVSKKDGKPTSEFQTEENVFQVNSISIDHPELWGKRDGGLEVFRGGTDAEPDARIVWLDKDERWVAGVGLDLSPICLGKEWDKLVDRISFVEKHKHSRLFSSKGAVLNVEASGAVSVKTDLSISKKILMSPDNSLEALTWYDKEKLYGTPEVEGPVFIGHKGGILGTAENGQRVALSWNSNGNVGIGTVNPTADKLDVSGNVRLMSRTNPLRFSSEWTAFPDLTTNQAEICNDTTYHKALMIVGNQSAGQGRKVAIWDRLDVNGLLYINGNMELSQELNVTSGSGSNGIIFPSDPGGGAWDGAWIKYYPRSGEACTLEIGTSNDGDDNIAFMSSGGTGIGTYTPKDSFDVKDRTSIMTNANPLRFSSSWSSFTEQSSRNSEISNDTSVYKTLMIVGNRSAGQERKVLIWDNLDVNGSLKVTANIAAKGAIIPGVGNCDVKGIMWPRDPYGGSGDAAWIRYYSDTLRGGGENMTLEIGIANDSNWQTVSYSEFVSSCPYSWVTNPCGYYRTVSYSFYGSGGDRLHLYASGGTYVDGNLYYTSTKKYKENIAELSAMEAQAAFEGLEPVEFNFKGDSGRTTLGFIAEDVPDVFAAYDKKAISPMEIMTVLVSEVKEQEILLSKLKKKVAALKGK
ncbi:MAG TPA: tail fiber domain-containing protein [Ruminiclostridium sp.]|nr:tail fiber domain-containing protein [Ruminiclostridium sp.]